MGRKRVLRPLVTAFFAVPLLAAVGVTTARVGDIARFVTWPVVAFTTVAAAVALVGLWTGATRPALLAVGVLPALALSYFLPAAPPPLVVVVLVALAAAAATADGVASGVAAGTGALMVLLVVLQGPAVDCGQSSVSTGSGPWWIDSPRSSSGTGSMSPNGDVRGTTQVGEHHYAYHCEDGRLTGFERIETTTGTGRQTPG